MFPNFGKTHNIL